MPLPKMWKKNIVVPPSEKKGRRTPPGSTIRDELHLPRHRHQLNCNSPPPVANGVPAPPCHTRPPQISSSVSRPPPQALPLTSPIGHFFSGVGDHHPSLLSCRRLHAQPYDFELAPPAHQGVPRHRWIYHPYSSGSRPGLLMCDALYFLILHSEFV
jgi:hypothetical protein